MNILDKFLFFIISLQVGLFPDVLERRVLQHLEKGDHVRHWQIILWELLFCRFYKVTLVYYFSPLNNRFLQWWLESSTQMGTFQDLDVLLCVMPRFYSSS